MFTEDFDEEDRMTPFNDFFTEDVDMEADEDRELDEEPEDEEVNDVKEVNNEEKER